MLALSEGIINKCFGGTSLRFLHLVRAPWRSEDRRIHHNAEGATSSSAKGKEEVRILASVGGSDRSVGCYDRVLQL